MIGFFPDPYPDELFYSVCARFQERVQYPNIMSTLENLFGMRRGKKVGVALPNHLGSLISVLPPGHHYTVERLIDEHTLLPFFSPFLEPERVTRLRKDMHGDNGRGVLMRLGITSSSIRLPEWLRFCPLCVKEEKKQFGECYWHRLHQLPGVEVCFVHNVFLENSKARARSRRLSDELVSLISAEQVVTMRSPDSLDSSNPCHQAFLEIARNAAWLLRQHNLISGLNSIRNRYLYLLKQCGLVTNYVGRVRASELSKAFRNHYPPDFLKLLHCDFDDQKTNNWLFSLVRTATRSALNPLHHLLLIHLLGYTAEEFFTLPEEFFTLPETSNHFGQGPWPCLNPVCKHFRRLQIQSYRISYNYNKNSNPTATFSCCTCCFVYSRTGPDQSPKDRFRFSRVNSYGPVWEAALKQLWGDPAITLKEIARQLGVQYKAVKRQAICLGLSFPRLGLASRVKQVNKALLSHHRDSQTPKQNKLATYRSEWLLAMREHPEAGRKFLRYRCPHIYYWLNRYDKEWLEDHLPPLQTVGQLSSSRVDWKSRDTQLAEEVRLSAERLRNVSGRPVRITKTKIVIDIGKVDLSKKLLDKLPLTAKVLAEVVETPEEFASRRREEIQNKTDSPL